MVRKLVTLPVVTSVVDDALAVHRGPECTRLSGVS